MLVNRRPDFHLAEAERGGDLAQRAVASVNEMSEFQTRWVSDRVRLESLAHGVTVLVNEFGVFHSLARGKWKREEPAAGMNFGNGPFWVPGIRAFRTACVEAYRYACTVS